MSQWRREASQQLPELQSIVASSAINTPAELWMELWMHFDRLCREEPPPLDLLARIWKYMRWCADQKDEEVQRGAISVFLEKMEDTRRHREVLLRIMSLKE